MSFFIVAETLEMIRGVEMIFLYKKAGLYYKESCEYYRKSDKYLNFKGF